MSRPLVLRVVRKDWYSLGGDVVEVVRYDTARPRGTHNLFRTVTLRLADGQKVITRLDNPNLQIITTTEGRDT